MWFSPAVLEELGDIKKKVEDWRVGNEIFTNINHILNNLLGTSWKEELYVLKVLFEAVQC